MKRAKISTGGQVSIPAVLRKRWGTGVVTIDDCGDHAVIRPAPADPITAARGAFKEAFDAAGKSTEEIRAEMREEERLIDEARDGV